MKFIWFHFKEWTDDNLRWNESEYENVKDIRVPPSTIWAPDILMYNRWAGHSSSSSSSFCIQIISTCPDLATFDYLFLELNQSIIWI